MPRPVFLFSSKRLDSFHSYHTMMMKKVCLILTLAASVSARAIAFAPSVKLQNVVKEKKTLSMKDSPVASK